MTPAKFWDGVSAKYAKMAIRNPEQYYLSLERTRSYLRPEDRVMELGCGTGSTALLLAPGVALYTGSDVSPGMIAIANGKLAEAGQSNLDFIVADADSDALGTGYDAVLAHNLLHLVDDLPATLRHVHDITRDGGLLISKTPCFKSKRWLLGPLIWVMQRLGKAPDVRFIGPDELEQEIAAAGFEVIEAEDYGSRYIVARKG
ncbi:class I SAM-dependent methyltransferase [Litoreibacter arenae]|uniref:Methyltransferase, UbiE/COQ5 family protein n=1 Tax=Litoreibacter arenae DSM 19593 TaxID=1123360 RepID=S9RS81_9RHOB|nr:class I SAM-dependent methyltransferase [Litoreibacter arenae]EPX80930.1 methyltransferase, UbiE/COQ5 family protein [Litoreibacter arenae DSM 19593]